VKFKHQILHDKALYKSTFTFTFTFIYLVFKAFPLNLTSTKNPHRILVSSRIMRFSPKCLEKITVYRSMQNVYQLVKYCLMHSGNWIHVISDVTLHVNVTPLRVEDRLLIKISQTEKGGLLKKGLLSFQRDSGNGVCCSISYEYFESTGFARRLSGSDRRRLEWTDSNFKSINNLNCSQNGQTGN